MANSTKALVFPIFFGLFCSVGQGQTTTPVFSRGYTVIPETQKVSLQGDDFAFGQGWQLKVDKSVASGCLPIHPIRVTRPFSVWECGGLGKIT
ncbi:MAG: hypothetical protein ABI164_06715 [Acidobacteriaceae bacterium]